MAIPIPVQEAIDNLNDSDEELEAKRVVQTASAASKAAADQKLLDDTQAVADQTAVRSQAFKDLLVALAASYED